MLKPKGGQLFSSAGYIPSLYVSRGPENRAQILHFAGWMWLADPLLLKPVTVTHRSGPYVLKSKRKMVLIIGHCSEKPLLNEANKIDTHLFAQISWNVIIFVGFRVRFYRLHRDTSDALVVRTIARDCFVVWQNLIGFDQLACTHLPRTMRFRS